jgi:copper resistance protein D
MTAGLRFLFLVFAIAGLCASASAARPPLQAQGPSSPSAGANPSASSNSSPNSPAMSDMPGMSPSAQVAAPAEQPWCEDNAWSTFNHRASGWFLILWGLTAFAAGIEWPRRTWRRYVAPMFLFGLAEFLFFRNDPEAWPTGPVSFWATLHNPEDLQHHIFLLLIILIGVVELLRAADRLPRLAAMYALPALGTFGAVLLFFHKHGGTAMATMMSHPQEPGMTASPGMQQMMASMSLVRHEHLWFSIIGLAFVAAKLLGDTGRLKGRWGTALWPIFVALLGAYMTGYVE